MIRTLSMVVALAVASPGVAGEIELLQAGAKPHHVLQYAPAAGAEQKLRLEMDVTMAMQMAGMDIPSMAVPTMFYELIAVAGTPSAERIPYTFTIRDVGVLGEGPMADAMKPDLAALVGTSGSVAFTPSGRALSEGVSEPSGGSAQSVDATLSKMALAFPEQAVGIGASWRVAEQIVEGGLNLEQVSTWTLVEARGGQTYVVDVEVSQKAGKQPMVSPGAPPGVTSELNEMTSLARGRTVIQLGSLLPIEANMSGEAKVSAQTQAMGQEVPMTSTITSKTRLAPSK